MFRSLNSLMLLSAIFWLTGCGEKTKIPEVATEMAPAQIAAPALIERKVLFGNPSRFQGRLSPDGSQMSFRAPLEGVMNLWVAPAGEFDKARPVTRDKGRGIPSHFWTLDSKNILYIQDQMVTKTGICIASILPLMKSWICHPIRAYRLKCWRRANKNRAWP